MANVKPPAPPPITLRPRALRELLALPGQECARRWCAATRAEAAGDDLARGGAALDVDLRTEDYERVRGCERRLSTGAAHAMMRPKPGGAEGGGR